MADSPAYYFSSAEHPQPYACWCPTAFSFGFIGRASCAPTGPNEQNYVSHNDGLLRIGPYVVLSSDLYLLVVVVLTAMATLGVQHLFRRLRCLFYGYPTSKCPRCTAMHQQAIQSMCDEEASGRVQYDVDELSGRMNIQSTFRMKASVLREAASSRASACSTPRSARSSSQQSLTAGCVSPCLLPFPETRSSAHQYGEQFRGDAQQQRDDVPQPGDSPVGTRRSGGSAGAVDLGVVSDVTVSSFGSTFSETVVEGKSAVVAESQAVATAPGKKDDNETYKPVAESCSLSNRNATLEKQEECKTKENAPTTHFDRSPPRGIDAGCRLQGYENGVAEESNIPKKSDSVSDETFLAHGVIASNATPPLTARHTERSLFGQRQNNFAAQEVSVRLGVLQDAPIVGIPSNESQSSSSTSGSSQAVRRRDGEDECEENNKISGDGELVQRGRVKVVSGADLTSPILEPERVTPVPMAPAAAPLLGQQRNTIPILEASPSVDTEPTPRPAHPPVPSPMRHSPSEKSLTCSLNRPTRTPQAERRSSVASLGSRRGSFRDQTSVTSAGTRRASFRKPGSETMSPAVLEYVDSVVPVVEPTTQEQQQTSVETSADRTQYPAPVTPLTSVMNNSAKHGFVPEAAAVDRRRASLHETSHRVARPSTPSRATKSSVGASRVVNANGTKRALTPTSSRPRASSTQAIDKDHNGYMQVKTLLEGIRKMR